MIPNGMTVNGYHTYRNLGMIPKSKIIIAPAIPKLYKFSVPGGDGELDHSQMNRSRLVYRNRKGTLNFLVLSGTNYHQAYKNCQAVFNGESVNMVLDDKPGYTYKGRFHVNEWKSHESISEIAVDYNIEP